MKQRLKTAWKKWKALSERVGNVQARVLLTVFYWTFVAPFGLWHAMLGDRLAMRRPADAPSWIERTTADRALDDARRQF